MKNIEKWLGKNGYTFRKDRFIDGRDVLIIDTDYTGLYPGEEQFNILNTIRKYISKYHSGRTVESRGYYTAIYIY